MFPNSKLEADRMLEEKPGAPELVKYGEFTLDGLSISSESNLREKGESQGPLRV